MSKRPNSHPHEKYNEKDYYDDDIQDDEFSEDDDDRKPPAVVITRRNHHTNNGTPPTTIRTRNNNNNGRTPRHYQHQQQHDDHLSLESMSTAAAATPFTQRYPTEKESSSQLVASYPSKPNTALTNNHNNMSLQENDLRRYNAYSEVILWSGSALLSTAALLYSLLPTAALSALAALVFSMYMLLTSGWNRTLEYEYHRFLQSGRGLGDYLPTSLYRLLTEQSWHEWLTDTSFALEHRHLLVYFLPLSEEQRNRYLEQLAPRHVQALQRPGLGHSILPPHAMRLLMGQERYPEEEQHRDQQQVNRTVWGQDQPHQSQQQQQQQQPSPEEEYEHEEQVLNEAMAEAVTTSVYDWVVNPVTSYARSMATSLLRPMARGLLGVSITSGGFALYAGRFWGSVATSSSRRPRSLQRYESTAWTTAAVTGTAAAVAYGLHWYVRSSSSSSNGTKPKPPPQNHPSVQKK